MKMTPIGIVLRCLTIISLTIPLIQSQSSPCFVFNGAPLCPNGDGHMNVEVSLMRERERRQNSKITMEQSMDYGDGSSEQPMGDADPVPSLPIISQFAAIQPEDNPSTPERGQQMARTAEKGQQVPFQPNVQQPNYSAQESRQQGSPRSTEKGQQVPRRAEKGQQVPLQVIRRPAEKGQQVPRLAEKGQQVPFIFNRGQRTFRQGEKGQLVPLRAQLPEKGQQVPLRLEKGIQVVANDMRLCHCVTSSTNSRTSCPLVTPDFVRQCQSLLDQTLQRQTVGYRGRTFAQSTQRLTPSTSPDYVNDDPISPSFNRIRGDLETTNQPYFAPTSSPQVIHGQPNTRRIPFQRNRFTIEKLNRIEKPKKHLFYVNKPLKVAPHPIDPDYYTL